MIADVFSEYPGCVLDVDREEPELRTPAQSFDRFWVLDRGGTVVGCIGCGDLSRPDGRTALELKKLYVHRSVRRRGLGARLIQRVEAEARERGRETIELWSDTRFTDAHAVYRRRGYEATGRTRLLHDLSHTEEYHFVKSMNVRPTERFSDRVADYARWRPTYPQAAFDTLLEGLADPVGLRGVDVGAGTGISTRALASRGLSVIAVEPNADMRERGRAEVPNAEWRAGTAEATGLDTASVDVVLCAQAFHWFDRETAGREFARLLRPGGRLGLLWNLRDVEDPLMAAYEELIRSHREGVPVMDASADPERALPGFGPMRVAEWRHEQPLDREGLVGRAMSSSYAPKEGPAHERWRTGLDEIYRRFADRAGWVRFVYRTRLFLAERADPA